jgi:cellulose synthase/poly-beta-1,6-N-acetylglucosamine synthase-like glycosyltransferase
MFVFNLLLFATCALLAVPLALFCLEVMLSLVPRRKHAVEPQHTLRRAVLIPAHNEEAVLAATLKTLLPTLGPHDRVLVVADNCTDGTAVVAHTHGAEAIVRFNAIRRGKGYALDFGLAHLALDPPDAVVFLDADCQVSPDTVQLLGSAACQYERPIQGLNLCDPDPNGGPLQAVSGLAFRFKNLVRTLGLTRLAGVCHLTGTGMALPWSLAQRAKLADGNVVEDMQLGIDFTLAGAAPLFLPAARVDSPLPQQRSAARTQRTRWEHGHLRTLLRQSPRLLALAITRGRPALFWLALDLAIPPLSLLVSLWLVALVVASLALLLGAAWQPAAVLLALGTALTISIFSGWLAHCRRVVPLGSLLSAPLYAAAKLPIYFAFLRQSQQTWVRTERDRPEAIRPRQWTVASEDRAEVRV